MTVLSYNLFMKERLDKILVDLGYFENKSKASASILAGQVMVNDEVITKAGYQLNPEKEYEFTVKSMPYVSRGGFKLQKALDAFEYNPKDRVCLDAGASTGGFTDCLLQRGAKFVYAVDVGYGQLAWKIRSDERVKTIEKTNLKICGVNDIYSDNEQLADLLVSDMSFISLERVLPNLKTLLNPDFHEMICLIKPQFEAGKEYVEKGGIITDKSVHEMVIEKVINCVHRLEYNILGLTFSSIKGPKGNIEYLIYFTTDKNTQEIDLNVKDVVSQAHAALN
ncbi:MAG: TlyA family RNA methyltransferase [Cyanobacteria bacterium RUI128]|nr:TlyA family RNA methyltransferase [Cyanobacteria bacterium RUI128]